MLPDETKVYCGHEYTVRNLEFALSVDPQNENVQNKLNWAEKQRQRGTPTVPSTLKEEKTYNPFMRCNEPEFLEALGFDDPVLALAEVRLRKDNF